MEKIASIDARSGNVLGPVAAPTTPAEVALLTRAAAHAAGWLAGQGRQGRARLLNALADGLEARRNEIVTLADSETALGIGRLDGELTRTCYQLRFMGEVAVDGGYLNASIEHKGETPAGLRPDLRKTAVPIGPIAVFGASNFPLAFSVPGGDTASALAAGCPVVVKAHNSHVGTSALIAQIFAEVLEARGVPAGVFGIVYGRDAGVALVTDAAITAVGFTGSLSGGRALFDLASRREVPIPFYGELGSVNPLIVTEAAAADRATEIGAGIAASMTLGVGQFCTKPGLFLIPDTAEGQRLIETLAKGLSEIDPGYLLNDGIRDAFNSGIQATTLAGTEVLFNRTPSGRTTTPVLVEAGVDEVTGTGRHVLLEERFGPFGLVTRYRNLDELFAVLDAMPAALTGTLHTGAGDPVTIAISQKLEKRSGRVVFNGYPTGVAVAWGMHHGGPYPASTASAVTSVGAAAISRWIRPVSFQDAPQDALPDELKNEPEHPISRRINGHLTIS
ncbi:aldehyde dehydrogenase (NADP(+)) [Mycobacterium sp. URHB0044]|uniref:aldehyde dehydrogenase (NADP(+)) n=1 Tax=Mycobacterium sp. URHB0044 TaxID=1380386 RepID=UPI000AD0DAD7|nr:aldehyde dehydrogenase (NADP(+)) [Mycobacterium sp. URHB0044]